mmetsp:Transcript_16285/g.30226  ORF Transcript_16285/g.30226 Transcript_16285/m.30226 type:complete len:129 (-) Transcript_16285:269-655(-)
MYASMERRGGIMIVLGLFLLALACCQAFSPSLGRGMASTSAAGYRTSFDSRSYMAPDEAISFPFSTPSSSSLELSAATLDPTSVLSDVFGNVIGSPLILAVPIVAALAVAGLIAFFIVSYANPEVDDD